MLLRALLSNGGLDPVRHALDWPGAGVLALVSIVLGQLGVIGWIALRGEPHALKVARLRNGLTRALRWVLLVALGLGGLGALDRLSWWILEEFQSGNQWLWGGVGVGGLGLVVLRTMMQPLQKIAAESGSRALEWLPRLLNVGSLLGLLALVSTWLVLMQWFIFAPQTFDAIQGAPAWIRASTLALLWLAWIVLTAGNAQMANTSSLHSFYRARLTRAYLAVGNRERRLADEHAERADVTRVVEGDDTALHHYRPEAHGGPIHLVNTCLNQTRDDKSGLYNADRKGTVVTASWRGFEIGQREFIAHRADQDVGTLGRWVSVSGAAASPGAGAYTSRGLALLVYFLGVRLGHWMRAPRERVQLRWLSALAWRFIPKPMMLASEASATFFGVERPWWYLSDGGHFENTGVYPLLKRELDFIILSDAGCDAQYEFGDIENLVRKARIDFGAEIDFYTREEAAALFPAGTSEHLTVLSPEDMVDNHSCRGVLLARIRYRERPGPAAADGSPGLLVRPREHCWWSSPTCTTGWTSMCSGMPRRTRPFRTNRPATSPSTRRNGRVTTAWARTSAVRWTRTGWRTCPAGAHRHATACAWRPGWVRHAMAQARGRPRANRCGGATPAQPPSAPHWAWGRPARCCCPCGRCRTSCNATAVTNAPRRASSSPMCPAACRTSRVRVRVFQSMW